MESTIIAPAKTCLIGNAYFSDNVSKVNNDEIINSLKEDLEKLMFKYGVIKLDISMDPYLYNLKN